MENESLTYVVLPENFVRPRVCVHFAFEVDVVALLDVVRIQIRAQREVKNRQICKAQLLNTKQPFPMFSIRRRR